MVEVMTALASQFVALGNGQFSAASGDKLAAPASSQLMALLRTQCVARHEEEAMLNPARARDLCPLYDAGEE